MSISLPYPLKVFCLTWKGHIVPTFITNELLLLDRNMLSKVKSRGRNSDPAQSYWIDAFNRAAHNINPIMAAYEGCSRRRPSRNEFREELRQSFLALSQLYPHKNVIEHSPETCDTLYDALRPRMDRQQEEVAFLMEAAPTATHRPTDGDLMRRIAQIAELAESYGLRGHSLTPIALISCLAESKSGEKPSPGRRIIKPSSRYSEGDAHNAVADLHCLEILMATASGPFDNIAFATMDRGLAEFWLSMKATRSIRNPVNDVEYRFTIDKKLCPRLNQAQLDQVRDLMQQTVGAE